MKNILLNSGLLEQHLDHINEVGTTPYHINEVRNTTWSHKCSSIYKSWIAMLHLFNLEKENISVWCFQSRFFQAFPFKKFSGSLCDLIDNKDDATIFKA